MQTGPEGSSAGLSTAVFGPPLLPARPPAAPRGDHGTGEVRVVTNPPGARVYLAEGRAGADGTVKLPGQPVDEGVELLILAPGYEPERRVVGPSDWERAAEGDAGAGPGWVASVDARPAPAEDD